MRTPGAIIAVYESECDPAPLTSHARQLSVRWGVWVSLCVSSTGSETHENSQLRFSTSFRTCSFRIRVCGGRDDGKNQGRLRQGWRDVGRDDQHLRGKTVTSNMRELLEGGSRSFEALSVLRHLVLVVLDRFVQRLRLDRFLYHLSRFSLLALLLTRERFRLLLFTHLPPPDAQCLEGVSAVRGFVVARRIAPDALLLVPFLAVRAQRLQPVVGLCRIEPTSRKRLASCVDRVVLRLPCGNTSINPSIKVALDKLLDARSR